MILRRGGPGDEGGEQGAASQYGGNSIYFCVTGLNLDLEFANRAPGAGGPGGGAGGRVQVGVGFQKLTVVPDLRFQAAGS